MENTLSPVLYTEIADLLRRARQAVVRTVNQTMVYSYYEIGRRIVEHEQQGQQRAEYGKQTLKMLSKRLTQEFGKGFSVENLDRMRYFYQVYSNRISSTVLTKLPDGTPELVLSWSHYLKLMRIADPMERNFYEIESLSNQWSLRELQRQFDSALYQRLALSRDEAGVQQLAMQGQIIEKPQDLLKDPYILEFLDLPVPARFSENALEQALIDALETFLLELGKGFTFVGRQVRFTFDERHFRVDLVFFNRHLRCFVLIDLKIGDLTHQDLGQMQMYVNYYDRFVKLPEEHKTIGIVLCRDKSDTLVEITLPEDNDTLFASRYATILPNKQALIEAVAAIQAR